MNDARRFRSLIIILLLILLLHLFIAWNIFYKPFAFLTEKKPFPLLHEKKMPALPKNSNDWAAMQAGGVPVIFAKDDTPSISEQKDGQATPTKENIDPIKKKVESVPSEEKKIEKAKKTKSIERKESQEKASLISRENERQEETSLRDEPAEVTEEIENQHNKQEHPETKEMPPDVKETELKNEPPLISEQNDGLKKKILPFGQMLKNLSNQWDNGTDPYTMQGKKDGKATADQLKHGNYRNKIAQCIQNGILTNRTKAVIRKDGVFSLTVNLIIALNGSIKHLSIRESSQIPTLDLFIIRAIEHAASSFPPVPGSFGGNDYPMPIHFENVVAIIEHPERLQWIL